jgi:MFS family permease
MAPNESSNGAESATDEIPYVKESYAWYVVGILMVVYIFSFVDRQILGLMVGPMKEDLGISDTQMSYLMGFMFALFYTIFGIPIGRLADSKSRRTIIAIGLIIWSMFSMACGFAGKYWQLALARMGVGVGEAALSPSAYSLITDYFRPNRMALAISVYGAGIYIGSGLAYLLGGIIVGFASGGDMMHVPLVGDVRPWQFVFFVIGFPGLLFTPMLMTIREPIRRGLKKARAGQEAAASVPLGEVFSYVTANWRTFLYHNVGFALCSFISYGSASWLPTFFIRIHDFSRAEIGIWYGTIVIIFGTAGIISGGILAGKLAERGYKDAKMRIGFIAAATHLPLGLVFPLIPNSTLALLVLCPAVFTIAMPFGVAPAAIQEMMPNRMRGQASAIYLFVVNLIGLGIGPSAVAWCTDLIFKDEMKIHYSLSLVSTVFGSIAAFLLYKGMGQFRRSLEHKDEWHKA